jgi:hypothetical protein
MEAQLEDWIKRVLRATMNWQLGNYIGADRDSYYGQLAEHRMLMKTWRKSKPLCRMWQKPNRWSEMGRWRRANDMGEANWWKRTAFLKLQSGYSLEPPATSPKKQEKNYQQQDEGEAATAVTAKARAHVITAAAEE